MVGVCPWSLSQTLRQRFLAKQEIVELCIRPPDAVQSAIKHERRLAQILDDVDQPPRTRPEPAHENQISNTCLLYTSDAADE